MIACRCTGGVDPHLPALVAVDAHPLCGSADGSHEANVVEICGAQAAGETPDLFDGLLGLGPRVECGLGEQRAVRS